MSFSHSASQKDLLFRGQGSLHCLKSRLCCLTNCPPWFHRIFITWGSTQKGTCLMKSFIFSAVHHMVQFRFSEMYQRIRMKLSKGESHMALVQTRCAYLNLCLLMKFRQRPTLILRVSDHSVLSIIIKICTHADTRVANKGGHILSFKELLRQLWYEAQGFKDL